MSGQSIQLVLANQLLEVDFWSFGTYRLWYAKTGTVRVAHAG